MNEQQRAAYEGFKLFMADPEKTICALLGSAGTGKSYTSARMYAHVRPDPDDFLDEDEMFWLAPTWKAVRVAGGFLDSMNADYEVGFDAFNHTVGRMILTTTQQALGIRPTIADNQTANKVEFAETAGASLVPKLRPKLIVIDEVSMLSQAQLHKLYMQAKEYRSKILIIGDPKQLPPVGAREIKWDELPLVFWLTEIMRQPSDSAIPHLGAAISAGKDWRAVRGNGVKHVPNAGEAFLAAVGVPSVDETERDVFIAYRNVLVDRMQEAACQKVYGHGANDFRAGEVVIAQSALRTRRGMLVANQDQLFILDVQGAGDWGTSVLIRIHSGREVHCEYLSPEDMNNPTHKFNLELGRRHGLAVSLQDKWTEGGRVDFDINRQRKAAWASYFLLKDQTVLSFAHPFAITSHKSQGSSYRNAYIAAADIENFDRRGLYVAATRAKQTLIY